MGNISEKTVKILFGQNGNQCSFPGCKVPMVDPIGTVLGEICHIHAKNAGGARFDSGLPLKERQSEKNLILFCGTHHKVIDDNPSAYQAQTLRDIKSTHNAQAENSDPETLGLYAKLLLNQFKANINIVGNSGNVAINSPGIVQARTLIIKQNRERLVVSAPKGTIGARADMVSYVQYLIARYNKFASKLPGRAKKFNFGAISTNIEYQFGNPWRLASEERFEDVCTYLKGRINKTQQAKLNKSKGHGNFHTFGEHTKK